MKPYKPPKQLLINQERAKKYTKRQKPMTSKVAPTSPDYRFNKDHINEIQHKPTTKK